LNTLLLLSALSGWNYDGFCDEPQPGAASPAPASAGVNVIVDDRPAARRDPAPPPIASTGPVVAPTREERPASPATAPAVGPTVWHLADAGGQVWNHTDAAWLRSWVESRNQAIARARLGAVPGPFQAPRAPYATPSTCPGNRCPRAR
jgi:hypothetical protein